MSSPGIDRPLTRLADYADWAGHEARVKLVDTIDGRKILTGDLVGIERRPGHDRRARAPADDGRALPRSSDAKLTITDRLLAATAPLSTDGADEEEFDDDDDHGASDETPAEELN